MDVRLDYFIMATLLFVTLSTLLLSPSLSSNAFVAAVVNDKNDTVQQQQPRIPLLNLDVNINNITNNHHDNTTNLPEIQTKPSNVALKSDKQHILTMYERYFFKPRAHEDTHYKAFVREGIIKNLQELGYNISFLQKSNFEFRRKPATSYNIITIIPGQHRHTKDEKILLLGAHWDSYNQAPGVDDNASGSICLLEVARLLASYNNNNNTTRLHHTIMLVWFDYEEQGKYGSEFFVNDYLYPKELDLYNSKFVGAYILDMILVRDKENNTQTLPISLKNKLKSFSEELESERNKGDFLATWSRKKHDEPLEEAFRNSWLALGNENRTFKAMRPELPQGRNPNSEERYEWKDFFRSDHASFWFPSLISNAVFRAPSEQPRVSGRPSLNAILLTDLGPWRKSYAKCYHSACDDQHLLTEGNLAFMQNVIDTLVLTLVRFG